MGQEGTAFIDADRADDAGDRERMKPLLWQHLPCDDGRPRRLGGGARTCTRRSRGCCACAASAIPSVATRFLNPSLDHLHDPFRLADMDRAVVAPRAGARPQGAHRHPRRLRRRRHHLDRDPAPRARAARRRRRPLHPRAAARRLRPAAGGDRAAARRRRVARRLGRLRHPRRRGGAARARARRRSDHHRPPRARRRRCRRRSRSSTRSGTTAPIRTRTSPASASR